MKKAPDRTPAASKDQTPATSAELLPTLPPQEARIFMLLADGEKHSQQEVHSCLWDEQGPLKNIFAPLSTLRKKLRPLGEDILTEFFQRRRFVRRVKLLNGPKS